MKFYQRDLKKAVSRRWALSRTEFIFYEYLTDIYLSEEAPLTETMVRNVCPVLNEDDKKALETVLNKFFYRDKDGYYHSIEGENALKRCREISEKRAEAARLSNQKNTSKANVGANAGAIAGAIAGAKAGAKADTNAGAIAGAKADTNAEAIAGAKADTNAEAIAGAIAGAKADTNAGAIAGANADTNVQKTVTDLDSQCLQNSGGKPAFASKSTASRVYAYAGARTRPSESDSDIDTDIYLKKGKSVSVSVSDISSEIKKINTREKLKNSELEKVLVALGLSKNSLTRWRQNNPERFEALLTHVEAMNFDDLQGVFSRCQKAKDKEDKPLANAVAFVVTALERQTQENKNRQYKSNPKGLSEEQDYRKIDHTAGLYKNAEGKWRIKPETPEVTGE